ncbi:hypothetical protein ACSBR1_001483 [Camellia fascicularis]
MTNGIPYESAPLEVSILLSIAEVEEPIVDEAGRAAEDIADIEAEEIYPPGHEPELPPLRSPLVSRLFGPDGVEERHVAYSPQYLAITNILPPDLPWIWPAYTDLAVLGLRYALTPNSYDWLCFAIRARVLLLYSCSRMSIQLRRVSSSFLMQNVVSPQAFMSSSIATEAVQESSTSKAYGSEQIQVLEGLDPVRKRPGMYIGSTGPRDVVLHADNSVSITDNGHGITTDLHPVTKKSALETLLMILHAGGKFGGSSSGYSVSGGLHGMGLSVVNALSEFSFSQFPAMTMNNEQFAHQEYQQKYSRGKPVTTLICHELPDESKDHQGTHIKFWPDKEVFATAIQFDYPTIAGRIRELAFLNPELAIVLKKDDTDPEKSQFNEYCYAGGLVEYVRWLIADTGLRKVIVDGWRWRLRWLLTARDGRKQHRYMYYANKHKTEHALVTDSSLIQKPLHDIVSFRKQAYGITVDVTLQW